MGSIERAGLRLLVCALAFMATFQLIGWLIVALALLWGEFAPATPLSDTTRAVLGILAIVSPLAALPFSALAALVTWIWSAGKFQSKTSPEP